MLTTVQYSVPGKTAKQTVSDIRKYRTPKTSLHGLENISKKSDNIYIQPLLATDLGRLVKQAAVEGTEAVPEQGVTACFLNFPSALSKFGHDLLRITNSRIVESCM
jgi:hypothetical protein